MERRTEEWFKQADYDMASAEYMFQGGRYLYAVFLCHLSLEKALKGLYFERLHQFPPKTHNLIQLLQGMGIMPPDAPGKLLVRLNGASLFARYPEDLEKIQCAYPREVVREILDHGKGAMAWIRKQL